MAGRSGVRDPAALEAALARPLQRFHYDPDADLASLAASYAYGISAGHPFVDGNKRVSLVACRTFLLLNGQTLRTSLAALYSTWMALAAGSRSEDELATWLRAGGRKV